ncbi:alpha/beta fold hydrolase [Roseomonas alkaliterrae]|uniref:Esterase/lipase superfamily enzyme n=1 Tax=Neoroseomonas alkaliterrae TaxID=1452450 RepID=A0A840XQG8_9PROT|nr:alpha/beta fold hydrolase [Neoroseomonas alkaliterrae]MBB5690868.1 esterase/lipase superfamily enzyme [Neoroseomonas alkaliterrae]MBR0677988.1 alpha/beta fold hydrolase [Neoroseomonas alkaliterrae]
MDVTVYFATNREILAEDPPRLGAGYNAIGPYGLRYGKAEVTAPAERGRNRFGDGYRLKRAALYPERLPLAEEGAGAPRLLGSSALLDELRTRLKETGADLLVLIHGFASTFESTMERAAQLKLLYGTRDRPLEVVAFSWPSNGRAFGLKAREGVRLQYFDDRMDAEGSAAAMARAFHRLVDFVRDLSEAESCGRALHLVAHSMGNYALRHALQQILRDAPRGRLPRLFENIFLMAADEDDDALNDPAKLAHLPELAHAVHVYMARNDRALVISDTTKANPDRLGATGPRTLSDLPRKITLVDCTEVSDTPGLDAHLRHQYYRTRPEVVDHVRAVLSGLPPDRIEPRIYVPASRAFRLEPYRRR